MILRRIHPYLLAKNSSLSVKHTEIVLPQQLLFELPFAKSKTEDIVQGLPKIEQLFEARRTSSHVMTTIHGQLKSKFVEYISLYGFLEATRKSVRFIQRVLVDEIQMVYCSQSVEIADKHIEIIVRQMTGKVLIHKLAGYEATNVDGLSSSGDLRSQYPRTALQSSGQRLGLRSLDLVSYYQDDMIDFSQFLESPDLTVPLSRSNQEKVQCQLPTTNSVALPFEPLVLGITKRAFLSESWVSSASFQEAKRILMNSALDSKIDHLLGLKENIIVGRYIRAGTGFRQ